MDKVKLLFVGDIPILMPQRNVARQMELEFMFMETPDNVIAMQISKPETEQVRYII